LGQILAVHAPLHAAVDTFGKREHLIVDHHRKSQGGNERRGKGLESGVQVAALAGEIIAGKTHGGIVSVLPDMFRGVDDQILAVADEIVFRTGAEPVDIGCIPIGRSPPNEISGSKACRDGKHHHGFDKEGLHRSLVL
jgi:hypothetical protein